METTTFIPRDFVLDIDLQSLGVSGYPYKCLYNCFSQSFPSCEFKIQGPSQPRGPMAMTD